MNRPIPDGKATLAPTVSLIVPCRNEVARIAACVEGLLSMEPPDGGFEVLVADGCSDDGTRELLDQLAASNLQLKVLKNPGLSASSGLNAAIRVARGEIIVRADAHTEYARDYLLRCLEVLQETGADNVGGPARTMADAYVRRAISAAYHSPFAVGGARFHDQNYEGYVDTVTYGCWPRDTFEKFGPFDEQLARNQDDEHNLRITRGGGKIYQSPKIRSWYWPRGSLSALFKQYMQYGYWKVRVIQKHKLPASWRHLVPGAFVLGLIVLSLLSAFCFLLLSVLSNHQTALHVTGHWSLTFLFALLFAYALALITASLITAAGSAWRLLPVLPAVFASYHFGYGFGFLRGILDFIILRRSASATFTQITRSCPKAVPNPPA